MLLVSFLKRGNSLPDSTSCMSTKSLQIAYSRDPSFGELYGGPAPKRRSWSKWLSVEQGFLGALSLHMWMEKIVCEARAIAVPRSAGITSSTIQAGRDQGCSPNAHNNQGDLRGSEVDD